mgnify:CR=1 FL=1
MFRNILQWAYFKAARSDHVHIERVMMPVNPINPPRDFLNDPIFERGKTHHIGRQRRMEINPFDQSRLMMPVLGDEFTQIRLGHIRTDTGQVEPLAKMIHPAL